MYLGKTAVMGMLDRDSREIRAKVIPNVKRETLQNEILNNIEYGSRVYTDAAVAYYTFGKRYVHEVVNHATEYVHGQVHTNGLENFWSSGGGDARRKASPSGHPETMRTPT